MTKWSGAGSNKIWTQAVIWTPCRCMTDINRCVSYLLTCLQIKGFNNCSLIDLSWLRINQLKNVSTDNQRHKYIRKQAVTYYKYLLIKCTKTKYWHVFNIKTSNSSSMKIKYKLRFLCFGHFVASVLAGFCWANYYILCSLSFKLIDV